MNLLITVETKFESAYSSTQRDEEPNRDDEENIRVKGVRMRRRNTTLDWQAIDYESRQNLRTARSGAKRGSTTALNRLSDALVAHADAHARKFS